MDSPDERLRPHPSTRMTGPVAVLKLTDLARALRAEAHPAKEGHRQTSLIHRGPLRVLLFTLEPGSRLPEHQAPGQVVIQCVQGNLAVTADGSPHRLGTGDAMVLDPGVAHAVEAFAASEMLLIVYKE